MTSIRTPPEETCASRRALTIRRSPCTPSAISAASRSAAPGCAGRSWASGAPPAPRPLSRHRATSSGSKTARATSSPTTRRHSTSTCGSRHPTPPRGWRAGRTSSPARSRCSSRPGIACGSSEQNDIIGRTKGEGAPAVGRRRVHRAGLRRHRRRRSARHPGRQPRAPRAPGCQPGHPDAPPRLQLRRRQQRPRTPGRGLFFLSYQRDPEQFIRVQRSLSTDVMSEYIRHVRSGLWAIPPGAAPGSYVGAGLLT